MSLSQSKAIESAVLAAVAGLLGYLMRTLKRGRKVRAVSVVLETLSSGFVGYMVFLLCRAMKLEDAWVGPIVGVFGWVGASASIRVLETVVEKRLGISDGKGAGDANS